MVRVKLSLDFMKGDGLDYLRGSKNMKQTPSTRHLGKRFRELLKERGLTPSEVAEKCKQSDAWVCSLYQSQNWESSTIYKIADALQIEPAELLPR